MDNREEERTFPQVEEEQDFVHKWLSWIVQRVKRNLLDTKWQLENMKWHLDKASNLEAFNEIEKITPLRLLLSKEMKKLMENYFQTPYEQRRLSELLGSTDATVTDNAKTLLKRQLEFYLEGNVAPLDVAAKLNIDRLFPDRKRKLFVYYTELYNMKNPKM
ncbi:hypothetical protein PsorP6_015820 [Peronosclerospora sorghi]|uniref:Uncharacterized protein n=1 Tax=Peronosclerospora sorghi TaxID=230839 RepID=A0ACC0WR22_9STRA|nr:hypothetical protein PsorP6_015820 [Peronosclerospora sorghi]